MNTMWARLLPSFLRGELEGREDVQNILSNAGWLFADKVIRLGMGLVVGVWVARYLGPGQFGQLSYAVAYVALFSAFATLGLDGIAVRELVQHSENENTILGTVFFLKFSGAIVTFIVAFGTIPWVQQSDPLMPWLVAITAAGTLFQAFDAIDFWFQSRVLSKFSVLAKNSAFLIASLLKIGLIFGKAQLLFFAATGLLEIALGSFALFFAFRGQGRTVARWTPTLGMAKKLLTDSWPLILSGISIMVYMRIGQIMLGNITGNQAVGIYSAATRISELWYFIPTVIVSSVYPSIIQAKRIDEGLYYRRLQRLFSIMTLLSLSIAIPMTFLSGTIVSLLFGKEFLAAGPVLAIHIWAGIFVFLGVAQGPWDLTENLTKLSLFRSASGALVNILLNLILIPQYGPVGTAIAAVISYMFSAYLLNVVIRRTRRIFLCQTSSLLFYKYLRFM